MKHILEQPLHKTLKQYRIIAVASIVFLALFLLEMWRFYETNFKDLESYSTAAFFGFAALVLGAFNKSINNIREKHED